MCGLVGILTNSSNGFNHPELDLFRDMLVTDSVRGEDSTGVFSVNKFGNAALCKLATHPFNLIKSKQYDAWKQGAFASGRAIIGHNRKATSGAVNNANAHPFVFGPVMLVHNGAFDNYRSLLSHAERTKHNVDVDSHAAAILLARNDPKDVVPQMKGAFAMIWYNVNEKKLYFVRNDERPLAFTKFRGNLIFASEALMLEWVIRRKLWKNDNTTITVQTLKAGLLLSTQITDKELEWEQHDLTVNAKQVFLPAPQPIIQSVPVPRRGDVGETSSLKERGQPVNIPEEHKFRIHYGNDERVDPDIEHQRIVWEIHDFVSVNPKDDNCRTWRVWGNALNSPSITVSCHMNCTKKEIEELAYDKEGYMLSLITRVKEEIVTTAGEQVKETKVTVLGSSTQPIVMVEPKDSGKLWKEHYEHMIQTMRCNCQNECIDMDVGADGKKNELMNALWIQNMSSPNLEFYPPICSWCMNDDGKDDSATANPDTPLLPSE